VNRKLNNAAIAAIALGLPACMPAASAQETVTVTLSGVSEARGRVVVALCDDTTKVVPGCRGAYEGRADAKAGETMVTIPGVKPGAYAVQVYHDANSDGAFNFPAEGYAYGNEAAYPPTFAAASIKVSGPTTARTKMNYAAAAPTDPMYVVTLAGTVRMGATGMPASPGVTKTDVRDNGLYGELYAPTGKTNLPAIIVLGGSEGGLTSASTTAASFNRQGYAVLVLAYFAEVGLPRTLENIPVEYFDKAVSWLRARSEVNPAKIGAVGGSRGSEAVLLMASRNADIRAVMAFAPNGIMLKGIDPQAMTRDAAAWSLDGKALPYVFPDFTRTGLDMYTSVLKSKPGAEIASENINGPILLISGEDDKLWPSTPLANQVVARLKGLGFKHSVQHLSYPGAGHYVFAGDVSGRPAPQPGAATAAPGGMQLGGTPEANYHAWTDNWPKTLKFFDDALKGS
jgi:dienelactone hydrolase/uncharacterized protein (DUF2141 family)